MVQQTVMVGSLAPEFSIPCTLRRSDGSRTARLSDYRGRWLMLVFYPRDFSLVCPTELTALSARLEEFQRRGCELLGVSTDTVETHEQWMAAPRSQGGLGGLAFPLAADVEGVACRAYGVYLEWQKLALRGLFIIDPNGVLQYSVVHNASVGRRSDEILRILDALQSGGLCPENWSASTAPIDPTMAIVPGNVLAHYRFETKLGSGSFGAVFQAADLTLERTVAVKVLRPEKTTSVATLLNEARLAAALQHPNICTVYSVDDSEGVPLIVMEYVAGGSLRQLMKQGPLPAPRAREIAAQVAGGMAAAHAAGIVHGDLKPENILLTVDGAAKITDFGLARRNTTDSTAAPTLTWEQIASGGLSGTPAYMAPELLEGQRPTPRSDVFALGMVVYEMLTGRQAVSGTALVEVLQRIRNLEPLRLVAELPEEVRDPVGKMLQPAPQGRPTMVDVVGMLSRDSTRP